MPLGNPHVTDIQKPMKKLEHRLTFQNLILTMSSSNVLILTKIKKNKLYNVTFSNITLFPCKQVKKYPKLI